MNYAYPLVKYTTPTNFKNHLHSHMIWRSTEYYKENFQFVPCGNIPLTIPKTWAQLHKDTKSTIHYILNSGSSWNFSMLV